MKEFPVQALVDLYAFVKGPVRPSIVALMRAVEQIVGFMAFAVENKDKTEVLLPVVIEGVMQLVEQLSKKPA